MLKNNIPCICSFSNQSNDPGLGRSSRTFITEGLWENLYKQLNPGDYILIQFGHNDAGKINDERDEEFNEFPTFELLKSD